MVISYSSDGAVSIKAKTGDISLNTRLLIANHEIMGPGEYDIAGIQCEGKMLTESVAYFIRTEDLVVTYLTGIDSAASALDDASATHVLVVDVRSNDTADALKPLVKGIEPSYVVLTGAGATPDFAAGLGLTAVEGSSLKLTRAGLPLEGTFLLTNS